MLPENTPTLETARLILRKYTLDDVYDFYTFMCDEKTNTFLPWYPLRRIDEAEEFLEKNFLSYYRQTSAYRYAICLKSDCRSIGYVWKSDTESHDFGYCLKRDFWHMGIVTEAAGIVAERIKNAGYPFITATHDVRNPHSGCVMKK